jgi:hypothetical protein
VSERFDGERLERALAEWEEFRALLPPRHPGATAAEPAGAGAELEAVRMAILLEDVLGVALSDEVIRQLRPEVVADRAALRSLLSGQGGR